MSEPDMCAKIGRVSVYYVDVHQGSSPESRKYVGIGSQRYPDITLEPAEALWLLVWLQQQRERLEQLEKEEWWTLNKSEKQRN